METYINAPTVTQRDVELLEVQVLRRPDCADIPLPAYQTDGAVGLDLPAAVESDVVLEPGDFRLIPCGFSLAVPDGYEAQVRPRSGLAARHGISMVNTPGTIDPDYRGEVKVILINLGTEAFTVQRGMRVAQMLIVPVPKVKLIEVSELPPSARGAGGFGHTGR
jgi:dUTP pyrophosphatase